MVGIISVVIGAHFGGGDHLDGGDHFGGGKSTHKYACMLTNFGFIYLTWCCWVPSAMVLLTCSQFFNATINMFTFIPNGGVEN